MTLKRVSAEQWKAYDELTTERDECLIVKSGALDPVVPLTPSERLEVAKQLEKDPSELERVVPWTFSTEQRDRDRDRIKQAGWDLKNYKSNPVILFGHNHSMPIGRSLDTWVDEVGKRGPRLRGLVQFMPADVNPAAFTIWRMVETGYLKASSVGFKPLVAKEDPEADEKDRKAGPYPPMLFEKAELYEVSIVAVPSNPGALQEAKSVHGIDLATLVPWAESILDGAHGAGVWVERGTWAKLFDTAAQGRAQHFDVAPRIETNHPKSQPDVDATQLKSALRELFGKEPKGRP